MPRDKKLEVNKTKRGESARMVKFTNIEFEKADLQFTYDKPIQDKEGNLSPNKNPRRWHFEDGKVYKVPVFIIEHINSLAVAQYSQEIDEATGQLRATKIGMRNRFSLVEVADPTRKQEPPKAVNE